MKGKLATVLLSLTCLISRGQGQSMTLARDQCDLVPRPVLTDPTAEAVISVSMDMSEAGDGNFGCGAPIGESVRVYESLLWAVNRLNQDSGSINGEPITDSYVPGIKIGLSVEDTCSLNTPTGLHVFQDQFSRESWCTNNRSQIALGSLSSSSMGRWLESSYPKISFGDSSHSEGTIIRTVPTNKDLAQVTLQVLNRTQTSTRSGLVYTRDESGNAGYQALIDGASNVPVCFTSTVPVPTQGMTQDDYKFIIRQLLSKRITQAVFTGNPEAGVELLRAAQEVPEGGRIQWIFSGVAFGGADSMKYEDVRFARGLLIVAPTVRHIAEFEDYYVRIDPNNPPVLDPFYREGYMNMYNCKLDGVDYLPYRDLPNCVVISEQERRESFTMGPYVESAITSVYTFARALRNAQADRCGLNSRGLCQGLVDMSPEEFNRNYLMAVDLTFSKEERIPTLASSQIEPFLEPKRVRYTPTGELQNPMFSVFNYNRRTGDWKFDRVGTSEDGVLSDVFGARLERYDERRDSMVTACLSCTSCLTETCSGCAAGSTADTSRQHLLIPGDIIIGGIFPVHNKGDGNSCGSLNHQGVDEAQAFLWAVSQISEMDILPGVSVGGLAFDSCSDPTRITNTLRNFNNGQYQVTQENGMAVEPSSVQFYVAGNTAESEAALLVTSDVAAPQVAYQSVSTSMTSSKTMSSVVPSENAVFRAMFADAQSKGLNYAQAISYDTASGRELVNQLKREGSKRGICIGAVHYSNHGNSFQNIALEAVKNPEARVLYVNLNLADLKEFLVALNSTSAAADYIVFNIQPLSSEPVFAEFFRTIRPSVYSAEMLVSPSRDYLNHLVNLEPGSAESNEWFNLWYEQTYTCSLDRTNMRHFTQLCQNVRATPITAAQNFYPSSWAASVINSVRLTASALHETLKNYCGDNYNGVCSDFYNDDMMDVYMEHFKDITFPDTQQQDINIVNGHGTSNIRVKSIGQRDNNDPTKCTGQCSECTYQYRMQEFMTLPGDVMIGGIFNVHAYHQGSPFGCGDINVQDGYQYTEALRYAIERVNKGEAPVSLSGVTLGGYGLDGCSSPLRADNLVSSLYSGAMELEDDMMRTVDVGKVVGWLVYSDENTGPVGSTLGNLGVPVVSPDSTSAEINNKNMYPTLFRTSASDDNLADAIVRLLSNLGWKYIQAVYSGDSYGMNGVETLRNVARESDICIRSSYEVNGDTNFEDLIKNLDTSTSKVVVVFAPSELVTALMLARETVGDSARDLVFISSRPWDIQANTAFNDNSMAFDFNTPDIEAFDEFMARQQPSSPDGNPWFVEYYQTVYDCSLGKDLRYPDRCTDPMDKPAVWADGYRQDKSVFSTLLSVYAVVGALDLALKEVCGDGYSGVCSEFMTRDDGMRLVTEKLGDVRFTLGGTEFKYEDGQFMSGYTVSRLFNGNMLMAGSYSDGEFTVTDGNIRNVYADVETTCDGSCLECRFGSITDERFTFIPGDILIAGVFDVHERGDSPFDCGEINMNQGFQLLEAFNYAIGVVNSKQGLFNGKLGGLSIGGLGMDACESAIRARTLVSNIHAGYLPIMSGNDQVNPGRIDGYVGSLTSDISADIAHVLNVLGIPQVSYGATSSVFTDKSEYPYFLRTVPGDAKLARAVVAVLNKFNLKYVQVVNSPGTYGEEAAGELVREARGSGVCVAQTITLPSRDLTRESADRVVQDLLRKPKALVVILFVDDEAINPLLRAVQRSSQARRFKFVGSETWNDNKEILKGVEDVAAGAITLAVETADLVTFDRYLNAKKPSTDTTNPWFKEFYEEMYECSLSSGSSRFSESCADPDRGVVYGENYEQDPYVLYTVNAVYAVALGIHSAIEEACGANYFGICEAFRNMGERRQKILNGIKRATFQDATGQTFDFDMGGESNRGYQIYSLEVPVTGQGLYYSKKGSYNDTHLLRMDSRFTVDWDSGCEPVGACDECPTLGRQPTRYMQQKSPENLNIVGFFKVHGSDPQDPLKCGSMDPQGGIQNALAFLYAINEVNKNTNLDLMPSVKLGGVAIDTCDNKLRVSQDVYSLLLGDDTCGITSQMDPSSVVVYMTSGDDATSAAVELLSPRGVTVITPDASGVDLSKYERLLSVVPPGDRQASALRDVLTRMGWTYVTVMSSTEYKNVASEFVDSDTSGPCVAQNVQLGNDASVDDIQTRLRQISQQNGARVVVLMTSSQLTNKVFQAAKSVELDGKFHFIVAGGGSTDVSNMPKGTVTIQARSPMSAGFADWLSTMDLVHHPGIPDDWFEEFWQHTLKCRLENGSVVQDYSRVCMASDRLSDVSVAQSPSVLHTIIATSVIAQGLDSITQCRNQPLTVAGCLSQYETKNQMIYDFIRSTELRVLPAQPNDSFPFSFTDADYGRLGYEIRNYRHTDSGEFKLVQVGSWRESGGLTLDDREVRAYDAEGEQRTVVSRCPTGTTCSCVGSSGGTTGTGGGAAGGGAGGAGGTGGGVAPAALTSPVATVEMNDRIEEIWGIIIVALTAVGIVTSICALVYLVIFYPNRSGTTILGYILLIGVICMYAMVFAFILYPDEIICSIRKFCLAFVYVICFSCMLVKVLNTWRLGSYMEEFTPPSYKRLSHPWSLFCIASALIGVQIIIGVEWLILEDTTIELFTLKDNQVVPRCAPVGDHNTDLILSCVYVYLLILLTAVFAAITWDSPESHRESRWIAIVTFMTVGIVLVWTIMSTLTDEKYREPVIAVALLVNATVILLFIFVRKIYLLNKIQKEIDEEEKKSAYTHSMPGDRDHEFFTNAAYDVTPHANPGYDVSLDGASHRGSHTGSGVMYVYNGGADMQF